MKHLHLACAPLLLALLAARAPADPKWSKPEVLSGDAHRASFPAVGVDGKGNATAVWMDIGDLATSQPIWRIRSATSRAGGGWQAAADPLSDERAFAPSLGVGADGSAVAAWELQSTTDSQTQAVARPANGSFGTVVRLTTADKHPGGSGSAIALDATGNGLIAYETIGSSANRLEVWPVTSGAISGARATFTEFMETNPSTTLLPVVLTTSAGPYVAFNKRIFPNTVPYLLGPLQNGAFPAGVQLLPAGFPNASNGRVAIDPDGTFVVCWRNPDGIYGRVGSGDPVRISQQSTGTFSLTETAGPDGTVIAAWVQDADTLRDRVWAAVRRPGSATFEAAVALSELGDHFDAPKIAFAGSTGFVVWAREASFLSRIEVSDLPPGGDFDLVAETISGDVQGSDGDAGSPSIAANAAGQAVVAWSQTFTDDKTGKLYDRVVARTTGYGPADLKAPRLGRFKVSPERFTNGSALGDIVVAAGGKTVMYPEVTTRSPLRAGTEFVFTTNEAGSYVIDIEGIGCVTFLPEGKRNKPKEHTGPPTCGSVGQHLTLSGSAVKKKLNRVPFFGPTLIPGGKYKATLTVTDGAGNASASKEVVFHFDGP